MRERSIPRAGDFYKHFKNNYYQVIAVATHTETREEMVVYQALYGDFGIYVRPLSMFLEPVDKVKYPDATQEYRFELVDRMRIHSDYGVNNDSSVSEIVRDQGIARKRVDKENLMEEFFDANTNRERANILLSMRETVTESQLHNMAVICDVVFEDGSSKDDMFIWLLQSLETKARFEIRR